MEKEFYQITQISLQLGFLNSEMIYKILKIISAIIFISYFLILFSHLIFELFDKKTFVNITTLFLLIFIANALLIWMIYSYQEEKYYKKNNFVN